MSLSYCAWCLEHYEGKHVCRHGFVDPSVYIPSWVVASKETRKSVRKALMEIQKEIRHGTNRN